MSMQHITDSYVVLSKTLNGASESMFACQVFYYSYVGLHFDVVDSNMLRWMIQRCLGGRLEESNNGMVIGMRFCL